MSIGVNLGVLPTKGLTLPLISSGGSSVMMTCAAMGLLLRISYELDRARRQRGERTETRADRRIWLHHDEQDAAERGAAGGAGRR